MLQTPLSFVNSPYDFSNSFTDPDGDPLTYSIAILDSSIGEVSINSITGVATFKPLKVGETTVTITANDGISGKASYSFTFKVFE
ncbi:hypothetical protein BRE01_58170 [Brevibacillus reuszeri]|uniref:Cadherin domain-containing protein n=1 Tax=Brevibacillus reuszeri TaxID=54915 RepID=A0ABQ0TW91_9BACL|nr:hypothetical protein BRE01_58170 [Brevibacillus reuszeri]